MLNLNNKNVEKITYNEDVELLESLIKEALVKEFGNAIQNTISYNLFVETVAYNLKKKQLEKVA